MEINWTSILLTIGTTMFGIILYQSREMQHTVNHDMRDSRAKIAEVHQEVENLKSALPMQYVLRDDFLRSISSLDTKMDRLTNEVTEINKNIGKIAGGEMNK